MSVGVKEYITGIICIYYIIDIILLSVFMKSHDNLSVYDKEDICKIGDVNLMVLYGSYAIYALIMMIIVRVSNINKVFCIIMYIIQITMYMVCTLAFFLACNISTTINFPIFLIYYNIGSNIIIIVYEIGLKYKVGWTNDENQPLI